MLRISKNVNKKDTCDNKVLSTNRFESLSSNKDDKHAFDKKKKTRLFPNQYYRQIIEIKKFK